MDRSGLIVLDASAAVELFTQSRRAPAIEASLHGARLAVPSHFDLETYSGVRRLVRRRVLSTAFLERTILGLARMAAERVEPLQLLREIHALGTRFAVADAAYVALAKGLDAEFVTCDAPLATACEGIARVRLI